MKGTREIQRRLKSVKNIKKITKAMEMVAATKLRRLQERALKTAPFANKIEEMIRRVSVHVDTDASPLLLRPEEVEHEAVVIISADRGLCGSYNSNLFRKGAQHLKSLVEEGVTPNLVLFGKRGRSFFAKTGAAEDYFYEDAFEKIQYSDVRSVVRELTRRFLEGEVQRVRIVHTEMRSLASFVPRVVDLLPIPRLDPADTGEDGVAEEYILDPSGEEILERLLPKFLEMRLYAAMLESLASEYAARRMAMKSATDNADDMISALNREYNKARQEGITGELLDIAAGLVALDS